MESEKDVKESKKTNVSEVREKHTHTVHVYYMDHISSLVDCDITTFSAGDTG